MSQAGPGETTVDRHIPQNAVAIANDVVRRRPVIGRRQASLVAKGRVEHIGNVHELATKQRAQRPGIEQQRRPQSERQERLTPACRGRECAIG